MSPAPLSADLVLARATSLLTPNRRWRDDADAFVRDARDVLASPDSCRAQLQAMADFGVGLDAPGLSREDLDRVARRVESSGANGLEAADLALLFADRDLLLNVAARLHPTHRDAFEAAATDILKDGDSGPVVSSAPARRLVIPLPAALVAAVLLVAATVTVTLAVVGPAPVADSSGRADTANVRNVAPANAPGAFVFDDRLALESPDPEIRALAASRLARRGELDADVLRVLVAADELGPVVPFVETYAGDADDVPTLIEVMAEQPDAPPAFGWMMVISLTGRDGLDRLVLIANEPAPSSRRDGARRMINDALLVTEEPPHDWREPFSIPDAWIEMLLADGPFPPDGEMPPGLWPGGWRPGGPQHGPDGPDRPGGRGWDDQR